VVVSDAVAEAVAVGLAVLVAVELGVLVGLGLGVLDWVLVTEGLVAGQEGMARAGRATRAATKDAASGTPRPVTGSQPGPGAPAPLLSPVVMSTIGGLAAGVAAIW